MRVFDIISSCNYVNYPDAVTFMENRVAQIYQKSSLETLWFLEHSSIYTAGTSANTNDLLDKNRFPIYKTGRGGQYTYHGPNQLIAYVMIDIQKRKIGIREYIQYLENTIIDTLSVFNIKGKISAGRVGVWVQNNDIEEKIAAIGVRVRRGVTYHGIAINIKPDLTAFNGIVPCGIQEFGVTSFEKLNIECNRFQLQSVLQKFLINNLKG
jgi:lipoyl(octanoyl) transferase